MSIADVLSIQLYTMRSLGDLDRILDAVAEAGYRQVETVNSISMMPRRPGPSWTRVA